MPSKKAILALKIKKKQKLGQPLIKQMNSMKRANTVLSDRYSAPFDNKRVASALESITMQNDLAAYMNRVSMDDQCYKSRRTFDVLTTQQAAGVLSSEELSAITQAQLNNSSQLRIPRRPHWDSNTTKEELLEVELEVYRAWRLTLETLSDKPNIMLTPFEKNPEVWKQLWRVVERSDVVVQIVDARNPMLFRCTDLENYVKEVDQSKVNLMLVNKSDFLSDQQREDWAIYFRSQDIFAVFFSALASSDDETLDDIDEETEHTNQDDPETRDTSNVNELLQHTDPSELDVNDRNHQRSPVEINNSSTYSSEVLSEKSGLSEYNSECSDLSDTESEYGSACSSVDSLPGCTEVNNSDNIPTTCNRSSVNNASESTSGDTSNLTSSDGASRNNATNGDTSLQTSSKLYNREELIELLQTVSPAPRLMQKHTTIGLVGYPNVGKSCTINCLLQDKKRRVSSTPGKTKHFQTLYLSPELVLCDCPGLVFPGFVTTRQEMFLWGILSIDEIRGGYDKIILHICHGLPHHSLEAAYSIRVPGDGARPPTPDELLSAHALSRSFMSARGRPDTSRSARYILKDFTEGRLLYCVAPPSVRQDLYHQSTLQRKCKNRVQLTPQQKVFMPETPEDVDARLDAMLGIVAAEEETHGKGRRRRKERVKKPKGHLQLSEGEDGVTVTITKPWRNRERAVRGKRNPNVNDPYGQMLW